MFSMGFALCLCHVDPFAKPSMGPPSHVPHPFRPAVLAIDRFGIYALTVGAYEFGRHIECSWPSSNAAAVWIYLRLNCPLGVQFWAPEYFALDGHPYSVGETDHGGSGAN